MKGKMKEIIKKALNFIANPRLLLCFGMAWLITNGWSYILFALGAFLNIPWMSALSGAYLTFLWLPISPEKIVTVAITVLLLRCLFPKDTKTLGVMRNAYASLKETLAAKRNARRKRREEETESDSAT